MQIKIDNLTEIETIDYIDSRGYKHSKKGLRDLKKIVSITFNTNSIMLDVLKNLLKYNKYIKVEYFKGKNTDTLFIKLIGVNHSLIKLFNRYNTILNGLTYKEQSMLEYIRDNSYISKKYSLDDVTDIEYGVYEPINTIDTYIDYDNYHNQYTFKNKRINYDKNNNIKKDVVSKILKKASEAITDFKLSVIDKKIKCFKGTKLDCVTIFNYMVTKKDKQLKKYYKVAKKEKAIYNNYDDFIKSVVCYGANHIDNNRFWKEIKRELY